MKRILSLICCVALVLPIFILINANNSSDNVVTEATIENTETTINTTNETTTVIEATIVTEPPVIETEYIEVTMPKETTVETEPPTEETIAPTEATKSYTDDELYILSHLIYGEASGCSWDM